MWSWWLTGHQNTQWLTSLVSRLELPVEWILSLTVWWLQPIPFMVAFSSQAKKIRERLRRIIPSLHFFFFKWRSARWDQLRSIRPRINPEWLSELRRLLISVPWRVAYELVSLMGSQKLDNIVSPLRLRWIEDACISCNLHFWLNDMRTFTYYCGKRRGETDTEIRFSTESWLWRRTFPRSSIVPRIKPATFRSRVRRFITKLYPRPSTPWLEGKEIWGVTSTETTKAY